MPDRGPVTLFIPSLNEHFGTAHTFWLCAGVCLIGAVLIKHHVPETRGRTLEQIERELVG